MTPEWNRRGAVIAARGSFAIIGVAIVLATVLRATGPAALHALIDLPFALICHRIPERVLSVGGVPMPLCSRCLGLWMGLSLSAALAWPALPLRALRVVLPSTALFMLIEVVTQDLGLHPVFHPTRLLSGLLLSVPLGGAIGAVLTREMLRTEPNRDLANAPSGVQGHSVTSTPTLGVGPGSLSDVDPHPRGGSRVTQ